MEHEANKPKICTKPIITESSPKRVRTGNSSGANYTPQW
jgi:hypothetical protein